MTQYYLMPASPITKIFLPDWRDELVKNPDKITDAKIPFTFKIPFATGAVGPFTFQKPTRLDDLPCIRRRDPVDTPALYNLLTGGPEGNEFGETDMYGLARIDMPSDATAMHMEMLDLRMEALASQDKKLIEAAQKKEAQLAKDFEEALRKSRDKAQKIADERVMKAVKITFERLKHQWQESKNRGQGQHTPSNVEFCCMSVLDSAIKQSMNDRKKINDQVAEMIRQIQTGLS